MNASSILYRLFLYSLSALFYILPAQESAAPLFYIPKISAPPKIDGELNPDEWKSAAGLSGFVNFSGKHLDIRGMKTYICYDADYLYMAFQAPYYPAGKKPRAVWSKRDQFPPKGFEEDRIEILLDPNYGQHTVQKGHFMIFFTASGFILYDQEWTEAEGAQKDWNTKADIKTTLTDNTWNSEIRIPFSDLKIKSAAPGEKWFVQISRYWSDFFQWTSLSSTASVLNSHNQGATMIFEDNTPPYTVTLSQTAGTLSISAELFPRANGNAELTADVFAGDSKKNSEKGSAQLINKKTATIPLKSMQGTAERNLLQLSLKSGDTVLYKAGIPFLKVPELPAVTDDIREKKFIFLCRYLPYFQKAWIDMLDYTHCNEAKNIDGGIFKVLLSGKELYKTTLPLSGTAGANIEVPLKNVIKESGMYEFHLTLTSKGKEAVSETASYEYINFPFVGSKAGTRLKMFPEFKAITFQNDTADFVCARMQISKEGLFSQIHARQAEPTVGKTEEPLLSRPIRLIGKIDGKNAELLQGSRKTEKQSAEFLSFTATGSIGSLPVQVSNGIEYDGLSWIGITLKPSKKTVIDSLTLEIPMDPARATLMYEITDKRLDFIAGSVALENGVVWDSMKQPNTAGTFGNFKPMVWVGNEDMGLTWCAESDRTWSLNERLPAIELVREKGAVILKINFVNSKLAIDRERTISFGIQPTPTKPMPQNWRSWLVYAKPELPNIKSIMYSAALNFKSEATNFHAWSSYIPYPSDYTIAKNAMNTYRNKGYVFLRYQLVDWFGEVAKAPEGRVYRGEWERVWMNSFTKSFQDFKAYHYDQYLKKAGFFIVYEDESYLRPMRDLALDAGYLRPDGEVQAEFGIRGLRETLRRSASVWIENNMPHMYTVHKSCVTMPPCHSFAAASIDGEQRFMDNPKRDYIDNWPLDFTRAHVMGRQFGVVPVFLSEVKLSVKDHGEEVVRKANRSMWALCLMHDIIVWNAWNAHTPTRDMVHRAKSDFNIGHSSVRFHPYWAGSEYSLAASSVPEVKVSVWKQNDEMYIVAANTGEDTYAEITFNRKNTGFIPARAIDYETQNDLPIAKDRITVGIPRHDFRIIFAGKSRVPVITGKPVPAPVITQTAAKKSEASAVNRPRVSDDLLFHAGFDEGLNAKSTIGNGTPKLTGKEYLTDGISGDAVVIGEDGASGIEFPAKNNLFGPEATVSFWMQMVNYKPAAEAENGIYHLFWLTWGQNPNRLGLQIQRGPNKFTFMLLSIKFDGRKDIYLGNQTISAWKNGEWHHVTIAWDTKEIVFYLDGLVAGRKPLDEPYKEDDFDDKFIKIGYETGAPGKEQTAVDEMRIYCRKLSDTEIRGLYNKKQ